MVANSSRTRTVFVLGMLLAASMFVSGSAIVPKASAACADTVLVRTVKRYSLTSGAQVVHLDTCTAIAVPGRRFLLEVLRPGGANSLDSARVNYDDVEYFGTHDIDTPNVLLSRIFAPIGADTLKVTLFGSAGAKLDIRITQVSEPSYQVAGLSGFNGATSVADKWYTRYFSLSEGVPAGPHVMTLKNGDSNGNARILESEVWLNSQQIIFPGEVTRGRAYISRNVTLEATNTLEVKLQGNQANRTMSVKFYATDVTPPTLQVFAPADSFATRASKVLTTVQLADSQTGMRFRVDGAAKTLTSGAWSDSVGLPALDGKTTFTLVAENGACLTDTVRRTVIRDTKVPTLVVSWPDESRPSVPADSSGISVSGTWVDSTWTVIRVDGDTLASGYSGPSPRSFSHRVPLDLGPNRIVIEAFDAAGNADTLVRYAYRTPTETAAVVDTTRAALGVSDLSATEATSFRSAIQFLYTGGDPVQSDLAESTLVVGREAVISGRVFARDFGGLPNVTVNVLRHPEYGTTRTRVDGSFDLAVNGGSSLTLRFRKSGFLEAQRDIEVPTEDYVILDDLALIGQRSRADSVNTTGGAQAVVTRFESDANGDRKLSLLFAPATVCSVTTSGGMQTYSGFHVRVKEFTVGGDGDESMPASLPPSTAYTYCVDLSVDEAAQLAQGDDLPPIVRFNQPVVAYVKEFLGMPVGSAMPSGYYDQRRAEWVASEDGTIVRVTSISGGLAHFDTNGDGVPDSLSQMAALGITTSERQQVAQLFSAGDSLWRMKIQHFSPHDFNENVAMMAASGSRLFANSQSLAQLVGAPKASCGCVIENENRVLGETIPVQGTPYALHYRSNRQPGDVAMRTLRIPLVGSPLPQDLKRIRIRVDVAGRRYNQELNYGEFHANDVFTFDDWDGCDRYGRQIVGSVTATVRVGLEFIAAYAKQSGTSSSFNSAADIPATNGKPATGERSVGRLIWTTQRVSLGAPSMASAGLGGWTITPHHYFDPSGRGTLWAGDGSFRYGYRNFPVAYRYAGNGESSANNAYPPTEGDPVVIGGYGYRVSPQDLAIGRRDSLYFTDHAQHLVLCISPDKRWHRVAGGGGGSVTDGAVATAVSLSKPQGLTVGRDGTVYFADWGLYRVFKVTPDGHIFTVAGNGSQTTGSRQEGALATTWPLVEPWSVALGPDGSVFISDRGNHRVLRVDTNGRIRTYAGRLDGTIQTGERYTEGKAAGLSTPNPEDLATDPQGNLYLYDFVGSGAVDVVWKITPDGRRTNVASGEWLAPSSLAVGPDGLLWMGHDSGNSGVYRIEEDGTRSLISGGSTAGSNFSEEWDGQFARGIQFASNRAIALDSRGVLFAGHVAAGNGANGISRISPELPGGSVGEIVFPSEDGGERYIFSSSGRHLRTEDAITGRLRYTFGYTTGQLTSITDADNRTTTIHRVDGIPNWIDAPFGQRTSLTPDPTGQFLGSVANAKGETHAMLYESGGLLSTYTNPRNNSWEYAYSAGEGRLESDSDPGTGGNSFAPRYPEDVTDTTLTVRRKSAENRTTTYDIVQMLDGVRRRLTHRPAYASTAVDIEVDSMSTSAPLGEVNWSRDASGVTSVQRPGRDSRFGWLAPVPARTEISLPISGRTRTVTATRNWSSDGRTLTETATLNGAAHSFSSVYDTLSKQLTLTTPAERTSTLWLNSAGRPTQVEIGTLINPVEIDYDSLGRLTHLVQDARSWRFAYDGRGRLETVKDPLDREVAYQYDLADRESLLTLPGGRVVLYRYDANGNLAGLTPPGGSEHAFSYTDVDLSEEYVPPSVTGIADPATRYVYNRDRQLTDVLLPDSSQVRLRYNLARGWLDSLTIARGRTTLTHAGPAGQLASATSPDTVTSEYAWDGPVLARETWSGAAAGAVARTLNDEFAEATQKVIVGGDSSSVVSYGYGDADRLLTSIAIGGATETIARRPEDGLISGTTTVVPGGTLTSEFEYNDYGEISRLRYEWSGDSSFEQVLERDALGRITKVTETADGAEHELGYHFDAAGRLDEVKRDGVVQRKYGFDDGAPGNGNRTTELDGTEELLAMAYYDAQDRLVSYGLGQESGEGMVGGDSVSAHAYATYRWTSNGELEGRRMWIAGVAGPETRYHYDALGHLTAVGLASGDSLTYVSDASDRRVGRYLNGTRTHTWLYANQLNIVAELDGSGALVNRFAYGTQGHVPDLLVRGGNVYRMITDHLGSVRAVVLVSDGTVAQRIDYDAWGVRTLDTAPGFQSLGFAGGLTDPASELVRFGARDYEPGVGRWTAKDRASSPAWSPYSYANDSPTTLIDPDGRSPRPNSPAPNSSPLPITDILRISACTGQAVSASIHGPFGFVEKYAYFFSLVHSKGPLDLDDSKYAKWLSAEDRTSLGNVNYGVLAKALGIPDVIALGGAGVADVFDAAVGNPRDFLKPKSIFLDDLEDSRNIALGFMYYDSLYGPGGVKPCNCGR